MIAHDDPLNQFADLYLKCKREGKNVKVWAKREMGLPNKEIDGFIKHFKCHFKVIAEGYPPLRYKLNKSFEKAISSTSALEPFAGCKKQYHNSITNDVEERFGADHCLPAHDFLTKMYEEHGEDSFDLVDIDPFSYSVPYFELGCKLARKGIIVHVGDIWYLSLNKNKLHNRYEYAPKSAKGADLKAIAYHFYQAAKRYGKNIVKYDEYKKGIVAKLYFEVNN